LIVNRILCPLLNEAIFALETGVAGAKDIDKGLVLGCNHPIGPLTLSNMIGLAVCAMCQAGRCEVLSKFLLALEEIM